MDRILIVDDDITARKVAGFAVERLGHIPIYSPDGQHALETLLIDDGIALLITDVQMPRMDGRELLKAVRAEKKLMGLPVIVMSAVVGPKEIFGLLAMGATRFQTKPLSVEVLQGNILASLEPKHPEKGEI
jgi:CheY-like chemotaxis protein